MRSEAIHGPNTSVPQVLMDTLASAGGPTALAVAQKAIDDLLSVFGDGNQQINALRTLEEKLILVLHSGSGERFELANELIELIDARSRTIRVSQKKTKTKQVVAVRPRDEDMFEKQQPALCSVA
jgi:hypothetical protein